jgi:hypothetical protein
MLYDKRWDAKVEVTGWRGLLLKAADILEQRGHTKNRLEDEQGRVCMGGALYKAAQGIRYGDVGEACRKLHESCGGDFVGFNNAPETTIKDVLAKMRDCAQS